jgi:hypothetical protein
MWAAAAFVYGFTCDDEYDVALWPTRRKASTLVAGPPQSSTSRMGMSCSLHGGIYANGETS